MLNYKEAIKRLRQETCPATYNPDFDKEECLYVIEEELYLLNLKKIKWIKKNVLGVKEYRPEATNLHLKILVERNNYYCFIDDTHYILITHSLSSAKEYLEKLYNLSLKYNHHK